jgi:ABC-type dipeptide/oligopeptide/nickel transport system ATPase component
MAEYVGVICLGRLAEIATAERPSAAPRHPYAQLLLDTIPSITMTGAAWHVAARRPWA